MKCRCCRWITCLTKRALRLNKRVQDRLKSTDHFSLLLRVSKLDGLMVSITPKRRLVQGGNPRWRTTLAKILPSLTRANYRAIPLKLLARIFLDALGYAGVYLPQAAGLKNR